MYVCICNRITDRDIQQSINSGVTSLDGLQHSLGLASCCGQCAATAQEILSQHLQSSRGTDPGAFDLAYAV